MNLNFRIVIFHVFIFALQEAPAQQSNFQFKADNTGKTLLTLQIQKHIDELSRQGGGTLYFPPGRYLTGSLVLKSGVILHFSHGAELLGSPRLEDYQPITPKYVALRTQVRTRQLIYAEDQTDIGLTGPGTINCQGENFRYVFSGDEGIERPHGIQLINCKNIRIQDVVMTASGAWMQHYLACENLQIRGIRVFNHANRNNDGIDIDGCRNVTISDCIIDSDDDALCLKSTSPMPSENISISNCVLSTHCNALKLGTESTGGFRNISFTNCTIKPSADTIPIYGVRTGQTALSVEMVDGGVLEMLTVSNLTVLDVQTPIFIRLGNRGRKYFEGAPEPGRGTLRQVLISNILARSSSLISNSITGLPANEIKDISLSNISLIIDTNSKPGLAQIPVPESEGSYPENKMFGDTLPASAFYIRHVRNLFLKDVKLTYLGKDYRPVIIADDLKHATLHFNKIERYIGDEPPVILKFCQDVNVKIDHRID